MLDTQTDDTFNLGLVFSAIAETIPERDCLVVGDRRFSYAEVAERSRRLASYLAAHGLRAHAERRDLSGHESGQDHVALALYNGSEYLEGMIGSYLSRTAPFNVNYRYVGAELRYLLDDAKAKAVIFHASLAPTIAEVLADLAEPPVVLLQVADDSGNPLIAGAVDYEDALASSDPAGPAVEPSADDLYVLYTGGTTGMPKGVLWRQHDIFMSSMGGRKIGTWEMVRSYDAIRHGAEHGMGLKVLMLPPLMHGAAQWASFIMFCEGATLVMAQNPRRLDAEDVWKTVEREGVNTFTVVGDATVRPLLEELDRGHYDTSSLFAIGNGGAPLTAAVRTMITERLPNVLISDSAGSSETGAQMSTSSASGEAAGNFQPGPGAVVASEELDVILEPGHEGIGWLAQGGWVPLGYLGDPEKSAKTFPTIEGSRYSIPGDRSRLRHDGVIELLGRDSVTINSGGEKIFAEEVEAAIAGFPGVVDVTVAGRTSERWGQEVVAVVQLSPGTPQDPSAIVEHASALIARYKLPKDIVFVELVQRSPSGKADYRWAREQAEAARND
ncbi:MAG: acyl-CoA synthetase [Actinomycetes bacterium]